jgi:hypothetical protein|tara:strand:+ start:154 stop:888 length:735 start_codon:yes stop_codon:yes gene_type:complete
MKDFNLDKAFMAVKAQRYEEAQNAYEAALQKSPSVEAWTGLGICKLFQLLSDQTMEEVVYCFNQARNIEGADKGAIELQLISYSALVAEQGASYCITLIDEIIQAEKSVANSVITAGLAAGLASNAKTLSGSIVSGTVAIASAGVAIGKLGQISNHKTAGNLVFKMITEIHAQITNYLIDSSNENYEVLAFNTRMIELKNIISEASVKGLNSSKWYNTSYVWVWLIFFWPVGVYGLIMRSKNNS